MDNTSTGGGLRLPVKPADENNVPLTCGLRWVITERKDGDGTGFKNRAGVRINWNGPAT